MLRSWSGVGLALFLSACSSGDKGDVAVVDTGEENLDKDGDGFLSDEDCNDLDAGVNPGVFESCNGVDDDCDGVIDDGIATSWYADTDGDGFGDPSSVVESCYRPEGYVPVGTDCDDAEAEIYPGNTELCDGLDNDCDGDIDEGATNGEETSVWYRDRDEDGYGDVEDALEACGTPEGYVTEPSDCDDDDETTHPDADETCDGEDDDCDGDIDEDPVDPVTWYADVDEDGYGDPDTEATACEVPEGGVRVGGDCDDTYAGSNPDADEVCDERDNDCDGAIDEDAADASVWYTDADDDGWGDEDSAVTSCEAPAGAVGEPGDCDDADEEKRPDGVEVCDDKDNDCDGSIDEGAADATTWYADSDGDAYGDPDASTSSCDAPSGYVADKTDCDDARDSVYPGATETCNDTDDDCDGSIDEGAVDRSTWYADADDDGYGDPSVSSRGCDAPDGYVSTKTDCDDGDGDVHPGATEICNDTDDDCDGSVDEGAADATTWYADSDGDAYGDASVSTSSCDAPSGYVADKTDCDDATRGTHPGATETCNDTDDDCDGSIDEGASDATTWYADSDADTYGDPDSSTSSCDAPSGYVSSKTDCDDTLSSVHPGASEYCNGLDDDCDGTVDDSPVDRTTWYKDADSDTYGSASTTKKACDKPTGYVADKTDCDDTASSVHPGATELCNDVDDDCDGSVDEGATDMDTWYADGDGDAYGDPTTSTSSCDKPSGYVSDKTDCDDDTSSVHPGATETCNDVDDDCDGSVDEGATDMDTWYRDADADSYGSSTSTTTSCDKPSGYVSDKTDCDDTTSSVHPGATETCNDIDDDCDGSVDEGATDMDTWYRDADADSYGSSSSTTTACDKPSGYVSDKTDCDDTTSSVHPGATETCNDIDDDCDGSVDEGAADMDTWYRDADSDSFGSSTSSTASCDMPAGYVSDNTDCNDGSASVYPGAYDTCDDGIDQDCDGEDAPCGPSGDVDLALSDARLVGEAAYDYSSNALSSAGDVNGDGYDDVLVGAYGTDNKGSYTGSAYVVLGPVSGTLDLSAADANLYGETSGDYVGSGTCPAGDTDGDGYDDVLIGARAEDTAGANSGAVYLVNGPIVGSISLSTADAKRTGTAANSTAGSWQAGGIDMDLDGYDDVFVSAYQDAGGGTSAGAVFLLNGPFTGTASLSTADGKLIGENANDLAGNGVDVAGDVDGDGTPDLVVGAYKNDAGKTDGGAAYLVLGPFSGSVDLSLADAKRTGEVASDYAGYSVGGPGDVDGDGYADLLVGAYNYDVGAATNAGNTYLLYGPLTGTSSLSGADAQFKGIVADDRAGFAVSGAGDVDSDGLADFLIGASREDTGGTDAGAAYLYLGGAWSGAYAVTASDALLYGENGGDNAGWDVSPAGDANGDGFGDLLIGAWRQETGGTDAGMGYLLYGGTI